MASRGRIYTVPPGRPFLAALAEALVAGALPANGAPKPDPLQLADVTLLLPTRRATRALHDAFLRAAGGTAVLLPRIRPIFGALEDDASAFANAADLATDATGDVKPAIAEIARQLALARLIVAWSEAQRGDGGRHADFEPYAGAAAHTPAQAAGLARELARLMDTMEIEDVDLARMRSLVPDNFSEHWGHTLAFLRIVTEHWPQYLDERGQVSKLQHDKQLVLAEARRLRDVPPSAPVIVAGVMSSAPAVTV
jgi:ATP-dependent helicase/nuclease subunit B